MSVGPSSSFGVALYDSSVAFLRFPVRPGHLNKIRASTHRHLEVFPSVRSKRGSSCIDIIRGPERALCVIDGDLGWASGNLRDHGSMNLEEVFPRQ